MPFFILTSIVLSYFVQSVTPLPTWFTAPIVTHVGTTLAFMFILLLHFKKFPQALCYDLFSACMLLAWFAYWKPLFNDDSPIFFFFPVYFALLTAIVTLFFTGERSQFDHQTLQQMQAIADKSRLKPWLVMLCVMGSLELQEHYLLFPVTMTVLILRFAMYSSLERK